MLSEYEQNLLERLTIATETIAEHLATIATASDKTAKDVARIAALEYKGAMLVQDR